MNQDELEYHESIKNSNYGEYNKILKGKKLTDSMTFHGVLFILAFIMINKENLIRCFTFSFEN